MWGLFSAQKPSISPPATDYPTKINAICDELDALFGKGSNIASAATVNIAAATGAYVHITGSTGPITSLGTPPDAGRKVMVVCDSTPTFTHHATNLILPGGDNYTAVAGDVLEFISEATGWRLTGITFAGAINFGTRALTAGAITGTEGVFSGGIKKASGITSCLNATPTVLFSLGTGTAFVTAYDPTSATIATYLYNRVAGFVQDFIALKINGSISMDVAAADVRVVQSTGSTKDITWSYFLLKF